MAGVGILSPIPTFLIIEAEFVKSAAAADDLPREGVPEVAMVGRSNVGKSSLINALVRQKVARTSAAPGKTRLANIYRVARGSSRPFYLVDLPGYGYARGGASSAREFEELTRAFFGRVGHGEARAAASPRAAASAGRARSYSSTQDIRVSRATWTRGPG